MLSSALRFAFDRMNGKAQKYQLGQELDKKMGCVRGTYDFSTQGGTAGTAYNLKDKNGQDLVLPKDAVITNVLVHVLTGVTSAGAATLSVQANAANDLLNADAKANLTANAVRQGVPAAGSGTTAVLLTADRTLKVVPNTADLTAGKVNVFVSYVFSGTD